MLAVDWAGANNFIKSFSWFCAVFQFSWLLRDPWNKLWEHFQSNASIGLIRSSSRAMVCDHFYGKLVVNPLLCFQNDFVGWVFLLNNDVSDAFCTGPCRQFTVPAGELRHHKLKLSFVMNIKLQEILEKCSQEEREVIERWFKNFQAIELSRLNGISIARGASTTCPLY